LGREPARLTGALTSGVAVTRRSKNVLLVVREPRRSARVRASPVSRPAGPGPVLPRGRGKKDANPGPASVASSRGRGRVLVSFPIRGGVAAAKRWSAAPCQVGLSFPVAIHAWRRDTCAVRACARKEGAALKRRSLLHYSPGSRVALSPRVAARPAQKHGVCVPESVTHAIASASVGPTVAMIQSITACWSVRNAKSVPRHSVLRPNEVTPTMVFDS